MSRYVPQQVNVGRIVDPISSLQDSLTSAGSLYLSALKADEEKRRFDLQEQRQAEQDNMSKQLHEAKMGELSYNAKVRDEEEARRKGLTDYVSTYAERGDRLGAARHLANRPELLGNLNENAINVSRDLLSKYDTEGRGLGYLLERDDVSAEDKARVRGINQVYADAPVWKEEETKRISSDLMAKGLVDPTKPQEAVVIADSIASGRSLKQAQESAAAAAKEQNEAIKADKENAKFALKEWDNSYKRAVDEWKATKSKGEGLSDSGFTNMLKLVEGAYGLDIGSSDTDNFIKDSTKVIQGFEAIGEKPPTEDELLWAAAVTFKEGPGVLYTGINKDRQVGNAEQLSEAILKRREMYQGKAYPDIYSELDGLSRDNRQALLERAMADNVTAPSEGAITRAADEELLTRLGRFKESYGSRLPAEEVKEVLNTTSTTSDYGRMEVPTTEEFPQVSLERYDRGDSRGIEPNLEQEFNEIQKQKRIDDSIRSLILKGYTKSEIDKNPKLIEDETRVRSLVDPFTGRVRTISGGEAPEKGLDNLESYYVPAMFGLGALSLKGAPAVKSLPIPKARIIPPLQPLQRTPSNLINVPNLGARVPTEAARRAELIKRTQNVMNAPTKLQKADLDRLRAFRAREAITGTSANNLLKP